MWPWTGDCSTIELEFIVSLDVLCNLSSVLASLFGWVGSNSFPAYHYFLSCVQGIFLSFCLFVCLIALFIISHFLVIRKYPPSVFLSCKVCLSGWIVEKRKFLYVKYVFPNQISILRELPAFSIHTIIVDKLCLPLVGCVGPFVLDCM